MRAALFLSAAALICLLLDALFGDPAAIPHPVVLIGRCIGALERALRSLFPKTERGERAGGTILAILIAAGTFGISGAAVYLAWRIHPALFISLELFWGWQCLAMRGLARESGKVQRALQSGTIGEARKAVSRIVGRDTQQLDGAGVARAAVETVAENFSDGVIAPMLYFVIGGAPFSLCYKAVNTMDSMIGYKNDKYLYFGRAAAKLDDAANLIPSRIAALFLIMAAAFCGESPVRAREIWRRDRRKHESPNSAQTEAAMAGALGVQLGGAASYFGTVHEKPTIGDPDRAIVPADIARANRMMCTASVLGAVVLGCVRIGITAVIVLALTAAGH